MGDGTSGIGSKNKFHHDAEVGKWGSGNSTGGGFGGNSNLGGINEIYINGNTSLDVTEYTYNGATYSDVKSLVKAVFDSGNTSDVFYVDFNVNGESAPRTARIRANSAANPGDDLTIDYQYKATYTIPSVTGASASTQEVFYYKRDGLPLNLPVLSDSDYASPDGDGIEYHANTWLVQGQVVSGGNVRVNASGDSTISNITQVADTSYGFRSSDNTLVVNSTGTVAVNASGRSDSITKIELPASGSVALDLSQATSVSLSGSSVTNNSVTNPASLISITFPSTNFTLGNYAFPNCTNLSGTIDLSNCTSLGIQAFRECSNITGVTLGTGLTTIPNFAFNQCSKLANINLSNVQSIGEYSFLRAGLSGTIDLSNCTSLGRQAFRECSNITGVTLGTSLTAISDFAFNQCTKLANIDLSNVQTIGEYAFVKAAISGTVNLSNCTSLGNRSFLQCSNITNVLLGSNVTTIPECAFYQCSKLTNIDLSNCTAIDGYAFEDCTSLSGTVNLSNCTSLGYHAFVRCSNITNVILGPNVTSIPEGAFYQCGKLSSINLSNCTSIDDYGFAVCTMLSGALDLSSCTTIGAWAFNNCPNITSVTFGNSLTSIGEGAFNDCANCIFNFSGPNGPNSITYTDGNTFPASARAFWDDGAGQVYVYTKWNRTTMLWEP